LKRPAPFLELNVAVALAVWINVAHSIRRLQDHGGELANANRLRFFMNRLRWLLWLLALGGLLAVGAARAALQFDVFVGYDGIGREASWLPIVCEIKNDGPPITGFVEVAPVITAKARRIRSRSSFRPARSSG